MSIKAKRYIKRFIALVGTWIVARVLVNWCVNFLYALDPGWLIVVLIMLADEAAPPVAAFAMLIAQFYSEAKEDGELNQILGKNASTSNDSASYHAAQHYATAPAQGVAFTPVQAAMPAATPKAATETVPGICQVVLAPEPKRMLVSSPDVAEWNKDISQDLNAVLAQHPYFDPYTKMCAEDTGSSASYRLIDLTRFIILDVETTGLNSHKDKIIEIAAVKFEHFQAVAAFHTLIDPETPLPQRITILTGITQQELANAPKIESIKNEFRDFIGDCTLIGHNLEHFDIAFLRREIGPIENPTIDTLDYARCMFPELPSYKLSYLKEVFNICVDVSHRALEDVKTTFFLFANCINRDHNMKLSDDSSTGSSYQIYIPPVPEKKPMHHRSTNLKSIQPTCDYIDPNNPLYKKRIVFTGELSMPRSEAMQKAVNAGALLRSSVSGKTDYLVVGKQDISLVGDDGLSTKQERAYELNSSLQANIKIIEETEFLELLGN